MASLFTTTSEVRVDIPFVGSQDVPFYLQFVPGMVIDVITNPNSNYGYGREEYTNSIMALAHITGNDVRKRKEDINEDDRYFPLLRGIYEVPSIGDPVLLCNVGGHQYYLGPLNTDNNPNYNEDDLYIPEFNVGRKANVDLQEGGILKSKNFDKVDIKRLSKKPLPELDNDRVINETHGDTILEGRHGNSIRIGSRKLNPYVIISNGRPFSSNSETIRDGSLITITEKGSLFNHFNQTVESRADIELDGQGNPLPIEVDKTIFGFTLASDDILVDEDPPSIFMGTLVSSVNNDIPVQEQIYDYSEDQILISSKRITLNSKLDDIYLSSNKDIHIGTKRHLTISTNKNLIIESEQTYLGDPNKKTMDNMVLGKKVQEALKGIIGLIKEIQINTQLGPQSPMPLPSESQVNSIIDSIISNKHFIEE